MELYSRDTGKFARSRPVVECAQCGERLFVPEWSEFVDARRVRHLWECEACGYAFETTVRLAAAYGLATRSWLGAHALTRQIARCCCASRLLSPFGMRRD